MRKYSNKGDKAGKTGFGEGLRTAGERNDKVVAIGADITKSTGVNLFAEKYPDRFFSFGIAEQNCVGVAAGLALGGKVPVFATYGVFSALRTTDQLRISVCYNDLHVIIGGAHAGISVGPDGATHQALEDLAVVRALPNMVVLSPCDATQTAKAVVAAVENTSHPVYVRFGREPVPDFTDETLPFEIGKGQLLHKGNDLTLVATGHLVWEALQAAYRLAQEGIGARVINLHTLKPIDKEIILKAAGETGLILTAEEHQVTGGLGSAVAEVVVRHHPVKMDFIGMEDRFGESGQPAELMEKNGMTADHIFNRAMLLLKSK